MHRSRSSVQLASSGQGWASPTFGARPSSRACSFKSKDDDVGAAMAAVRRAVRSKQWTSAYVEASNHSASSPSLHGAGHFDSEEGQMDREEREEMERLRALEAQETVLRAAMESRNLASLRKAINNAATQGVPGSVLDEARAMLRLEHRVQCAVAEGSLGDVRAAVSEVHRYRALSGFPCEPPFDMHQELEYWSEKRGETVRCRVMEKSADGKILVNLKKKSDHWFSLSAQRKKFRVVDMDLATAAPQVCLDAATSLLDKADDLQSALKSEDVGTIKAAVARARQDKCLSALVGKAETFLQEAMRRQSADEAEAVAVSSDAAAAWRAAKKSIRHALRAESDRAFAEAAGKGWGDLEWDLAVERLAALEKSFDSTDLGSLEQSIRKLESEDLDISTEVVEEAQSALRALENQRDELHKAMREGDIDTMKTAIRFARELLLPEELINEAMAALDMALILDEAIKSEDSTVLASTLAQLERDGAEAALLEKARGILHAMEVLEEALDGKDIGAIEKAMCAALNEGVTGAIVDQARQVLVQDKVEKKRREESARKQEQLLAAMRDGDIHAVRSVLDLIKKEHALPEELMSKARAMVEIGAALDAALKAGDHEALASAFKRAEREGFDMPLVQKARVIVQASEALQAAMQSNDIAAIEEAIRIAGLNGVPPGLVSKARQAIVDTASQALELAMQSGDIEAMEEAIRIAGANGVPLGLVAKARQTITTRASEALEQAMQSDDISAIEEAIRLAGVNGVPAALVAKAQQAMVARASKALELAMQSDDLNAIEEAIRNADPNVVPAELLAKARQAVVARASDALERALQSNDVKAIEEAMRLAGASGVPAALVEKARQVVVARASEALEQAMQCNDIEAMEEAIRIAEANGVPAESLVQARQKLEAEIAKREEQRRREEFLANLDDLCLCRDTLKMRAAIAEGEALGFQSEIDTLRATLEDQLEKMHARAWQLRQEKEKIAAEFRSAKEAQDMGGGILAAQWRAAVAEVGKPFVFSEEEECARLRQQ